MSLACGLCLGDFSVGPKRESVMLRFVESLSGEVGGINSVEGRGGEGVEGRGEREW